MSAPGAVLGLGTGYTIIDFAPYGWTRGNLNERFEQLAESIQIMQALAQIGVCATCKLGARIILHALNSRFCREA